jgi:flagellar biosynthesis regulator FlaF
MKQMRWISLMLLLALLVPALTVLAQGDEMEWEEFVSEDELLIFSYPKGWFVESAGEDIPLPAYQIANSEEALERLMAEEDTSPEAGDVGLIVLVIPADFLALLGVEIPEDATETDLAVALVTSLNAPDSEDEEAPEIGEPVEVELTDELVAGSVPVFDAAMKQESVFTVFALEDGVLVVSWVGAPEGELTEELIALGQEFAASIAYAGTGEDLMNAMMGIGMDTETGAALDGAALVDERCTVCHTRERIDAEDLDEAGWTEIVDDMVAKGAQLDDAEKAAVIAYLVETH